MLTEIAISEGLHGTTYTTKPDAFCCDTLLLAAYRFATFSSLNLHFKHPFFSLFCA